MARSPGAAPPSLLLDRELLVVVRCLLGFVLALLSVKLVSALEVEALLLPLGSGDMKCV